MAKDVAPYLANVPLLAPNADTIAFVVVVALVTFFSLVLGELVPKSLALRASERYALWAARPLLVLSWLAQPLVWLLTASSNVVLKPFRDRTTFTEARLSAGEIQQIVDEATETGSVHPAAGDIASRAIDFVDLTAAHVMVPRHRVVGIPKSATPAELRRLVLEHGKTRMLVFDATPENFIGYVTIRDVMALVIEPRLLVLDDAIRPPHIVPETMRAVDLLSEMRQKKVQLAIVVDELGAMRGIVTIEDLVDELIGEIRGEHEELSQQIRRESDASVLVLGDTPIRDVNRELDLELPEGDKWSTVAGLVLDLAGRIPGEGEQFDAPDGTTIEIVQATAKRVERVRINLAAAA
jgi:putative hemolysin